MASDRSWQPLQRGLAGHSTRLATIALAVLLLTVAGCEINKPELPSFTTTVVLPLDEERIDMADIVADEDYLFAEPDSSVTIMVDGSPTSLTLDYDLTVDLPDAHESVAMGDYDLTIDPLTFAFSLGSLYPPAAGLHGVPLVVPPFTFAEQSGAEALTDVDAIVFAGGTLRVDLSNGLPVPFSGPTPPEAAQLEIVDALTDATILTLPVPEIAPGASTVLTTDLAGVTLGNAVAVRLAGGSPGSSGATVLVDGDDAVSLDVTFVNVTVDQATAVVEPQTFGDTVEFALPPDYAVTSAEIGSGTCRLDIRNDLPVSCSADIVWPTILDGQSQPASLHIDLSAGAQGTYTVDFAGHTMRAPGGGTLTSLSADIWGATAGSGGFMVDLRSDQGLTIDLSGSSLAFQSLTGVVPQISVPIDPITETLDLPDELEGIQLTTAALVVEVTTTTGVPVTASIDLTGTSGEGQEATLAVQAQVDAGDGRNPSTTILVFDESNSDLVPFLNNLPSEVVLTGTLDAGGAASPGTVSVDDYADIDWSIAAPVEVIIDGAVILADPNALNLDESLRERIRERAGAARFEAEVTNHFPVGVSLRLLVYGAGQPDEPLVILGPLTADAGTVDAATHTCVEAVVSHPFAELTAEEAPLLGSEGLTTRVEVTLPSSGGQPIRVLASDYVTVRGVVRLDIAVDDDW